MRIEWLLNPVTVYAVAAVGLLLGLALFVGLKWEIAQARALARESQDTRDAEATAFRALQAEVASLREALGNLEAALPGPRAGAGINLTRRAKALRMHRRGEPVSSIAAALETPANEIELLLKVHALTGEAQQKAS